MFIDDLITRYAPKDETFKISLFDDEVLTFKRVLDYSDMKKLQEGAALFAVQIINKKITLVGDMAECWTDNVDTLTTAYVLSATLQEPKMSELEFLKLAKKAGAVYGYIVQQYNYYETEGIVKREFAEVEDQKKD